MRAWQFNLLCILIVLISGTSMFFLKYRVMDKEDKLASIYREIAANQRDIHMLTAEWTDLNDPERLRALVKSHMQFKTIQANQIVKSRDLKEETHAQ